MSGEHHLATWSVNMVSDYRWWSYVPCIWCDENPPYESGKKMAMESYPLGLAHQWKSIIKIPMSHYLREKGRKGKWTLYSRHFLNFKTVKRRKWRKQGERVWKADSIREGKIRKEHHWGCTRRGRHGEHATGARAPGVICTASAKWLKNLANYSSAFSHPSPWWH